MKKVSVSQMMKKGFKPGQVFTRNAEGNAFVANFASQHQSMLNKGIPLDFLNRSHCFLKFVNSCSTFVFIASQAEDNKDFLMSDSGQEYFIPFSTNLAELKEFLKYYSPSKRSPTDRAATSVPTNHQTTP